MLLCGGCDRSAQNETGVIELRVLMAPDPEGVWRKVFDDFHRANPGIRIHPVEGPSATNTREDLYVTSFLSRSGVYDLVFADVPWVAKFAAAGWIEDITGRWDAANWDRFLAGAVEGSKHAGKIYRMPVQMDGGVLFYRADLLEQAGEDPPESFEDLVRIARALQDPPESWGFVWQGKQYEGLSCNFNEILEGFGGTWVDPETGRVGLDEPEAIAAVKFLVDCIRKDPVSPPGTTTYEEDPSRQLFESGRAVFHRNWPYVWKLAERETSPIRGRVGMASMPRTAQGRHASTLGGWGFAIASDSRHKDEAWKFLEHMATVESVRVVFEGYGNLPALHEFYQQSADPFLQQLYGIFQNTIPRPTIPQYSQASDILQRYVSSALTGRLEPEQAMRAAAKETRLLLGSDK